MVNPQRSRVMRTVKGKNTKPEIAVRRMLYRLGYRYRLHRTDLPGKPDIVFPGKRRVVFVNGCFWHGHDCQRGNRIPKTNVSYWSAKIERNRKRDTATLQALRDQGWRSFVVWECEIKNFDRLQERLVEFLR